MDPGSFRDPAGFVFYREGVLLRQVNHLYREDYEALMQSGLYDTLADAGLLVPHEEAEPGCALTNDAFTVIRPQRIGFVSYPFEWCFGQLKAAALATLAIQAAALRHGMWLRDASAYNVQFRQGKALLIDTLSLGVYREGEPWPAYRQFCQHFLAPLALMSYADARLGQLLRIHLDGVPLDLAARLLPLRTRARLTLLCHLHLHARMQSHLGGRQVKARGRAMGRNALLGLIDSLRSAVEGLRWRPQGTPWADYYTAMDYAPEASAHKREVVGRFLERLRPASVWDFGANEGVFSRIAALQGARTVAFDSDPAAVERAYRACVAEPCGDLLPLVMDLTNPTPAAGWHHRERLSLLERGPADAGLALALIHHLAIGGNLPFARIAEFFRDTCRALVIEFVPKEDARVRRMLARREDIFPRYTREGFEREFGRCFTIEAVETLRASGRSLYLMRRRVS